MKRHSARMQQTLAKFNAKMSLKQLHVGSEVRIVYGMGQVRYGTVTELVEDKVWGNYALIEMEDGVLESVKSVVTSGAEMEMGCHVL